MYYIYFLIFLWKICKITACKGCVNLDESSLPKILPRFPIVLVKFDVAFPYGDKHEIFTKFAAEVAQNNDILLGEVGVKDYGEKDNEQLAKSYGVSKDDYPSVKLFKKGTETPVTFPPDQEFNLDNLRHFIRDNSDIYLGLPGCIEVFDKLAQSFMTSKDRNTHVQQADDYQNTLDDQAKESAKTYILVMKKILESGVNFIDQERERVTKLLKGKISAKKQNELTVKLNILRAFNVPQKDEL